MGPPRAAALLALLLSAPAAATDPSGSPGLPRVLTLGDALPNPAVSFMAGWSSQCTDPGCNRPSCVAALGDQGAIAALVTGQRGLAVEAAEQGLVGAESARQDVLRDLDFQVKQQFVNTAVAAQTVRFSREEASIAEQVLEAARERRAAGTVTESDVIRLEVLHGQIEQLAGRAVQAFEQARASLARLLGFRSGSATFVVDPGPVAVATVPPRLAGATVESLTEDARANRPDLAAARAQLEQARVQASLQRRLVIPAFQLQAQYAQQGAPGGWFTPPTASVGLSIPLPVLYQRQGEIGQADAGVLAAEASVRKVEAQVLADVATAFANLETYRRNAERSQVRLVPRARDARDRVGDQYARGTAGLLDYLDAQRSLIHSEMDRFSSVGDFWTAVFQVERAVGASYHP